ncbi:MAG: PDZ domain-containing protein [Proteobacteria bacterium]|nr:PDZ domain-containing protein [Pseudomonadota bacterium]
MRTKIWLLLTLLLVALPVMAEEGPADARRHMIRGVAAIEMAKSNAELALAADEFKRATELDPNLSAAWYNLGSVQSKLGQFDAAILSYQRYLARAPNAEDTQKVQDEIIKLEFRQEQAGKATSRAGLWIASDGTLFNMKVEGNRLTLSTEHHPITDNEAVATYTFVGTMPILEQEQVSYQLELTGNKLTGNWMHSAVKTDQCTIPEERGDVKGELNDANQTIVLHYSRTSYRAPTIMAIFPGDYCGGIEAIEKRDIEMTFRGPLPQAWPMGFGFSGLQRSLDIFVKIGWFGRLKVDKVLPDTPAEAAGLRAEDEILAIDGSEIKSLTAGETAWRLLGHTGSEVSLTVLHSGSTEPVVLHVRRTEAPANLR